MAAPAHPEIQVYMHCSLASWRLALSSILMPTISIGSFASPSHSRPWTYSSSRPGRTNGSATPSESSLEQWVTFRLVPTRSILWTTTLACLPSPSLYTITPATTRGEECSRPILTSRAQRSLLVLPLLEGLNSVPKLQSGMVTNAS